MVEFVIECPVDGPVEVSLEDIDTVIVRESESADIVFTCPVCGAEVRVTVRVPSFLLSAIESLAEESGGQTFPLAGVVALSIDIEYAEGAAGLNGLTGHDDGRADAYCEYFRRQLDSITCVDDVLAQIDSET